MTLAVFGKFSLMRTPGAAVGMALNGLWLLMSKVSVCGGPPTIQTRTQALGLTPAVSAPAARAARTLNHGAAHDDANPAAARRRRSRRSTRNGRNMDPSPRLPLAATR